MPLVSRPAKDDIKFLSLRADDTDVLNTPASIPDVSLQKSAIAFAISETAPSAPNPGRGSA